MTRMLMQGNRTWSASPPHWNCCASGSIWQHHHQQTRRPEGRPEVDQRLGGLVSRPRWPGAQQVTTTDQPLLDLPTMQSVLSFGNTGGRLRPGRTAATAGDFAPPTGVPCRGSYCSNSGSWLIRGQFVDSGLLARSTICGPARDWVRIRQDL